MNWLKNKIRAWLGLEEVDQMLCKIIWELANAK